MWILWKEILMLRSTNALTETRIICGYETYDNLILVLAYFNAHIFILYEK